MIKKRTIIIFGFLWLLMAWFIVVKKIAIVIKLYPIMTLIYILVLAQIFGEKLGEIIKNYYEDIFKQLTYNYPMVNSFASIAFIFSPSEDSKIQEVKNTGKLLYAIFIVLFLSMPVVSFIS